MDTPRPEGIIRSDDPELLRKRLESSRASCRFAESTRSCPLAKFRNMNANTFSHWHDDLRRETSDFLLAYCDTCRALSRMRESRTMKKPA